jgi:hypothetical protein
MKQLRKQIVEEKLIKVPAALDLTPYRDEKDFGTAAIGGRISIEHAWNLYDAKAVSSNLTI